MEIVLSILFTLILVSFNGYFAMSEMALVSARRAVLQQKADEEGSKQAREALDVSEDSDKLLAAIQVFITLIGFGSSALATATLAEPFGVWLSGIDIPWLPMVASALSVIIVTLIISYVSLVFGELLPKRVALSNPEGVAMRVAHPISRFERLASPFVRLLAASTNAVAKIFGIKGTEDRQEVTEEEIKYLVTEQDTLLDEEKRMIHEIFDLGDTTAREVMVPRVDITMLEDTATVGYALSVMRDTGYSRVPICHEGPDSIIGIIMVKDLIDAVISDREEDNVRSYMRAPVFVPEMKDILPLLGEMQTSHQQMVIVVDEYGGTAGLITIEDIVEEIVGEIADEFDSDNKYLTRLSDTEWLVDGRFPLDDALEEGFPVAESDEYETLAGWLLDMIDTLPLPGDTYEKDGYTFKVQSMRRKRIAMVRVSKHGCLADADEDGDASEERSDED